MPPFGFVTITGAGRTVTARFDPEESTRSGGNATYEDFERPKRVSLVRWNGVAPRRQQLVLLLDNSEGIRSDLTDLDALSKPPADHEEPPKVRWDTGGVLEHDRTRQPSMEWRVDGLDWDGTDFLARSASKENAREPTRQRVTVSLVRITEAKPLGVSGRAKAAGPAKGVSRPPTRVYQVREGDTLQRIAQRELGDSSRWPEIKALNPQITDTKHPTGQIRLPGAGVTTSASESAARAPYGV